jgi:hypothetical protein
MIEQKNSPREKKKKIVFVFSRVMDEISKYRKGVRGLGLKFGNRCLSSRSLSPH